MTQRTTGIDLAIRSEHVAQIFEDGRPLRFRHDPNALDAFVTHATANLAEGDTTQAVMEPTGMSWFPVAHRLADAGVSVARVKSKRIKAQRRYLSEHAKADLADTEGRPVALRVTAGQIADCMRANALTEDLAEGAILIADKGYDTDALHAKAMERKAWAKIPPKANRKGSFAFSG